MSGLSVTSNESGNLPYEETFHTDSEVDNGGTWTKVTSRKSTRRLSGGSAKSHTSVHTASSTASNRRSNTPNSSRKSHASRVTSPLGTNPVMRERHDNLRRNGRSQPHIAWRVPYESKPPKVPKGSGAKGKAKGTKNTKPRKQHSSSTSSMGTIDRKGNRHNLVQEILAENTNFANSSTLGTSGSQQVKENFATPEGNESKSNKPAHVTKIPNTGTPFVQEGESTEKTGFLNRFQHSHSSNVSLSEVASSQTSLQEGDQEKLRLKLWNVLFRNVNRAVDELYYMCEYESSIEQCCEAVLALELSIQEFDDLRVRIQTQNKSHQARPGPKCNAENNWTKQRGNTEQETSTGSPLNTPETESPTFQKLTTPTIESTICKGVAWEVRTDRLNPSTTTTMLMESSKNSSAASLPKDSSPSSKSYASVIRASKSRTAKHDVGDAVADENDSSGNENERKKKLLVHLGSGSRVRLAQAQSREHRKKSIAKLVDSAQSIGVLDNKLEILSKLNVLPSNSAWVRKPNIVPDIGSNRKNKSSNQSPSHSSQQSSPISFSIRSEDADKSFDFLSAEYSRDEAMSHSLDHSRETQSDDGRTEHMAMQAHHLSNSEDAKGVWSQESTSGVTEGESECQAEETRPVNPQKDAPCEDPSLNINAEETLDERELGEMRWGDESVGMSLEGIAMIAPISPSKSKRRPSSTLPPALRDMLARSLHDKLSSPERRKPSPSETRRRQVEKQVTAQLNRAKLDLQRQARLKMQAERQHAAAKIKEQETIASERALVQKLERAAAAREANLRKVVKKAEVENIKVNEILFINEMTELDREAQLHKKLEDGERRRLEYIDAKMEMVKKQSERERAAAETRKQREGKLRQQMETRLQEAKLRKEAAMLQYKRKLEEFHIDAPLKASERREVLEREREARLLAIKRREMRATLERQKVLLSKSSSGKLGTQMDPLEFDESEDFSLHTEGENGPSSLGSCSPVVGFGSATQLTCEQMRREDSNSFQIRRPRSAGASLGGSFRRQLSSSNDSGAQTSAAMESFPAPIPPPEETLCCAPDDGSAAVSPAPVELSEKLNSASAKTPNRPKDANDKSRKKKRSKLRKLQTERIKAMQPIVDQMANQLFSSRGGMGGRKVRNLVRSLGCRDDTEPSASELEVAPSVLRDLARILEQAVVKHVPALRVDSHRNGYVNPFSTLHGIGRSPTGPKSVSSSEKQTNVYSFSQSTELDVIREEGGIKNLGAFLSCTMAASHPRLVCGVLRVLLAATCLQFNVDFILLCTSIGQKLMDVLAFSMKSHQSHSNGHQEQLDVIQGTIKVLSILLRAGSQTATSSNLNAIRLIQAVTAENSETVLSMVRQEAAASQADLVRYSIHSLVLEQLVSAMFSLRVGDSWMGCRLGGSGSLEQQQQLPSTNSLTVVHRTNEMADSNFAPSSDATGTERHGLEETAANEGEHRSTDFMLLQLDRALGFLQDGTNLVEALLCTSYPPCDSLVNVLKSMDTRMLSVVVVCFHSIESVSATVTTLDTSPGSNPKVLQAATVRRVNQAKVVLLNILRTMNHMARCDLKFMQEALGAPAMQFEFQDILKRVRGATSSSNAADKVTNDEWIHPNSDIADHLLAEYIVMIGYYALENAANQESLNWGLSPTSLQNLCSLPFQYFVSREGKTLLIPSLMAICYMNSRNLAMIEEEINPKLFVTFLKEQRHLKEMKEKDSIATGTTKFSHLDILSRFPFRLWDKAEKYFAKQQ